MTVVIVNTILLIKYHFLCHVGINFTYLFLVLYFILVFYYPPIIYGSLPPFLFIYLFIIHQETISGTDVAHILDHTVYRIKCACCVIPNFN